MKNRGTGYFWDTSFFAGVVMIINGVYWQIAYVSSGNPVLKKPNGIYTFGVTDLDTQTVYISDRLSGALLKRVVAHEICHCFVFSYGLHWDINDEEMLCDFVSKYAEEIVDNLYEVLEYPVRKLRYEV